jgi:hypothetical protein
MGWLAQDKLAEMLSPLTQSCLGETPMTDSEWETCNDPMLMLGFVRGKISDRKLLLFAAACFRRLLRFVPDERQLRGIELLEQMAEGTATPAAKREVTSSARHALPPANYIVGEAPADV